MPKVKPLGKVGQRKEVMHNIIPLINSLKALKEMQDKDMCEKAGINRRTWCRRKNEPETLTLEEILKISETLGREFVIGKDGIKVLEA